MDKIVLPAEDAHNIKRERSEVLMKEIGIDLSEICIKLENRGGSETESAKATKRNKKTYKNSLPVIDEVTVEDTGKEEKLDNGRKKTKRKKGVFRKLIKVFRKKKSTAEDKQVLVEEQKEEPPVKKKRRIFSKKALRKARKKAGKAFVESMHYMAIGMSQMSGMMYYPTYADYYSKHHYDASDPTGGNYRPSFIYIYP